MLTDLSTRRAIDADDFRVVSTVGVKVEDDVPARSEAGLDLPVELGAGEDQASKALERG
jgi:hypothetical protein